jgi:hypothetical protein
MTLVKSPTVMLTSAIGPSPWTKIQAVVKPVGLALGFIGLGVWIEAVHDGTAKLPFLQQQAATLNVVEHKTLPDTLGKLAKAQTQVKQLDCDKTKLAGVAFKGILANQSATARGPDWSELKDCPKVAPIKPPPVSTVIPKVGDKS